MGTFSNSPRRFSFPIVVGGSALIGAGVAFFFEPQSGRRRRHRLREKGYRYFHEADHALARALRDLANRSAGQVAEWEARLHENAVDDETLSERIRSKVGHLLHRPTLLEVRANSGWVHLTGTLEPSELAP